MRKYFLGVAILSICLYGCGGRDTASKPAEPGVVDYLTGNEQIKTYHRTKAKIQGINNTLKERNAGFSSGCIAGSR